MKFGMEEYTMGRHLYPEFGPDWEGLVGTGPPKKERRKLCEIAVFGFFAGFTLLSPLFLPSNSLLPFPSLHFPLLSFPAFFVLSLCTNLCVDCE